MKIAFYFIHLFILLFIIGCANPQPPSGGPKDTTPPKLIRSYPEQNQTNFKDKKIELVFDKYMDKNKVIENLQISPFINTTTDWSGKKLKIFFTEVLKENTTYILTIGTSATDYLQNKLDSPITLVFSTGEIIDTGIIRGKIFNKNPKGISVFAYFIEDINPDTLDARQTKPNYSTECASDGSFQIMGLKDGIYRIIAIRDAFKNHLYDEGLEDFGVAGKDIVVKNGESEFIKIKVRSPLDTIRPMLYSAEQIDKYSVNLAFSEEIDTLSVKKESFFVVDTLKKDTIKPISAFISPFSAKQIWLFFEDTLKMNTTYKIFTNSEQISSIKDTAGNFISPQYSSVFFKTNTEISKSKFEYIRANIKDSSLNIAVNYNFKIVFNKPLNKTNKVDFIWLENQQGKKISTNLLLFQDNLIYLYPEDFLQDNQWYILKINLSEVNSIYGEKISDTTIVYNFKTEDLRDNSSISGVVSSNNFCTQNLILNIYDDYNSILKSQKIIDSLFSFNKLKPTEIYFEIYCDINNNNKYDFGKIYPFQFSEPFYIFENKIKLKPRWTFENIILKVP